MNQYVQFHWSECHKTGNRRHYFGFDNAAEIGETLDVMDIGGEMMFVLPISPSMQLKIGVMAKHSHAVQPRSSNNYAINKIYLKDITRSK